MHYLHNFSLFRSRGRATRVVNESGGVRLTVIAGS